MASLDSCLRGISASLHTITHHDSKDGGGRATPGASYLQDVGKGREHDYMDAGGRVTPGAVTEERKLEGSTSDGASTNCIFVGNAETIAKQLFQPYFQRTRTICGLKFSYC